MRNDQSVTQRARAFPGSVAIVSRINANKVMTYVNDDLVNSSSYAREVMIP